MVQDTLFNRICQKLEEKLKNNGEVKLDIVSGENIDPREIPTINSKFSRGTYCLLKSTSVYTLFPGFSLVKERYSMDHSDPQVVCSDRIRYKFTFD